MKKGQQNKTPVSYRGTLDYHFAKRREKTDENDDSVRLVREVRLPTDKDPDWAVSNGLPSGPSLMKEASNCKPKRLRDVLRRRKSCQMEQLTDNSVEGLGQERILTKLSKERNNLSKFSENNRPKSNSKRCNGSIVNPDFQLPEVDLAESVEIPDHQDSVFVRTSPKRKNKPATSVPNEPSQAADPCSCTSMESFPVNQDSLGMIFDDLPASANRSGAKTSDGTISAAPCLSLRVLDSQEYYSEDEQEKQLEGNERGNLSQSQLMEIDLDVLAPKSDLRGQVDSGDDTEFESQPMHMDIALLQESTKNSNAVDADLIDLSSGSSVESELDVFSPRRKGKCSAIKDAQSPQCTSRERINRQLFPEEQQAIRSPQKESPCKGLWESPKKAPRPSRRYRGKGWGPRSAQKSGKAKYGKQSDGKSPKTNSVKKKKHRSPASKGKCETARPSSSVAGTTSARSITPDNDLEDVMLSLDDTNTYSPTKLAQKTDLSASTAQDNRPITPDDDLEDVMLSLNDSNTYSPTKQVQHRIPYYLASVRTAIEDVMSCPIDVQYMDTDDVLTMELFSKSIEEQSQLLYLRMLFRNYDWIPKGKLKYDEISNLSEALEELVNKGLLQSNQLELPLEELLGMLSVPMLKKVCKDMKINDKKKRPQLIQSMVQHAAQRNAASMLNRAVTTEHIMIKRVRKLVPRCYKLTESHRSVFMRVFMLYGLVFDTHSGSREQTQSQLIYMMLREAVGQIEFPKVPLNRQTKIFMDREHVLRRQEGHDLEEMLDGFLQKKDFEGSLPWVAKCQQHYRCWIGDSALVEFDEQLPSYLRRYTCTSQIIRCLGIAADLLQKLGRWQQAADIYHMVLSQRVYSMNSRGFWYERLSVIYHSHIKDAAKAAAAVAEALQDPYVRVGYRLSIYQRGVRLWQSKPLKRQIGGRLDRIGHEEIKECPTTEISGVGRSGTVPDTDRVNVFLHTDTRGRITRCSVESVAMEHYMSKYELDKGLHRESSVYTTMFGLLFWDIIYKPGIADTFFNNYQFMPLDFQSDEFYLRRRKEIDGRLSKVRSATVEKLKCLIEPVWSEHKSQSSICVIWDVFESLEDCLDLMLCIGAPLLADICERLVKNYRFCRSGMPDLTMWNGRSGGYKIVEVKGPNDKLSTKQILWADYLLRCGANVEVCYVKLDGTKR